MSVADIARGEANVWNTIGLWLLAFVLASLLAWHLFRSVLRVIELGRKMGWHYDRFEFFRGMFVEERMEWRVLLAIIELFALASLVSHLLGYGCLPVR